MDIIKQCQKCGVKVIVKTWKDVPGKEFFYEVTVASKLDAKIFKRLGIPFRELHSHKCINQG